MTLVKRTNNLFPHIPSFFDDFLTRDLSDWSVSNFSNTGTTLPSVNIRETNDDYHIEVAVPGLKKDDFKVELENNMLVISSEVEDSHQSKDGDYTRKEFSYQSFQRTFSLPENSVDADKIKANYVDGILHLVVPKMEEAKAKPARTIKIS